MTQPVRTAAVRIPTVLEREARAHSGLGYLSLSALTRVSLGMLAGYNMQESLDRFARTADLPDRTGVDDV